MPKPHTSYIVCSTPRSGSTLLCETLDRTKLAGLPREYFFPYLEPGQMAEWGVTTFPDYFERVLVEGTTPNGVFGVKIMWLYLRELIDRLAVLDQFAPVAGSATGAAAGARRSRPRPIRNLVLGIIRRQSQRQGPRPIRDLVLWIARRLPRRAGRPRPIRNLVMRMARRLNDAPPPAPIEPLLSAAFPNLRYIYIVRRDKVRQAISLYRAMQSGVWMEMGEQQATPEREPVFDKAVIDDLMQNVIIHDEEAWQRYFRAHNITPLTIYYEDLAKDVEGTARKALAFLGVTVPDDLVFAERKLRRQSDDLTEAWVRQYHELDARARTTGPQQVGAS